MAIELKATIDLVRELEAGHVRAIQAGSGASVQFIVETEPHIYRYWRIALAATVVSQGLFETYFERKVVRGGPWFLANVWYAIVEDEPHTYSFVAFTP